MAPRAGNEAPEEVLLEPRLRREGRESLPRVGDRAHLIDYVINVASTGEGVWLAGERRKAVVTHPTRR